MQSHQGYASSRSSGSRGPCMRPIISPTRCFPVCSSQCTLLPPAACPARTRSRIASASDSKKRPTLASWIAASNADTESACSPSAAWHRPSTRPARTFDDALKLKSACNSATAKLRLRIEHRQNHRHTHERVSRSNNKIPSHLIASLCRPCHSSTSAIVTRVLVKLA